MPAETDPIPPVAALEGDDKDNVLAGGDNDDRLLGRGGNDTLTGNLGSDYLDGGDGDDTLTGDNAAALDSLYTGFNDFAFDRDDGTDTITDFKVACPACLMLPNTSADHIVLKGGTEADIDAAVKGATTNQDGNTVVTYGETKIVLTGVGPIEPSHVEDYWFELG